MVFPSIVKKIYWSSLRFWYANSIAWLVEQLKYLEEVSCWWGVPNIHSIRFTWLKKELFVGKLFLIGMNGSYPGKKKNVNNFKLSFHGKVLTTTLLLYFLAPIVNTGLNLLIAYGDFGHQLFPYLVYFQLLVLCTCFVVYASLNYLVTFKFGK